MTQSHPRSARRPLTPVALAVLASLGVPAAAAPAQVVPSMGVGTHAQEQRGAPAVGGVAITPALRAAVPFATLDASALRLIGAGGGRVARDFWTGSAAASVTTPRSLPLRGALGGGVRRDIGAGFAPATSAQVETRLRYDRAAYGLWTSQATGAATTSEGGRHFGGLGAGFWARVRGVTITTSLGWMRTRDSTSRSEQYVYQTPKGFDIRPVMRDSVGLGPGHVDTVYRVPTGQLDSIPLFGDTTGTRMRWGIGPIGYTDVESGVAWARGGVTVSAAAGTRLGLTERGRRSWGSAGGSVRVSRHAALVAGVGREPEDPARGLPARRYASLGMRFSRTPLSAPVGGHEVLAGGAGTPGGGGSRWEFDVAAGDGGGFTVRVRAPAAREVEIMGSFTDWQPVALAPAGDGRWEVTLTIPAGIHQVNMRVDRGAWRAPPGLTTTVDGFSGTVGVLVIE